MYVWPLTLATLRTRDITYKLKLRLSSVKCFTTYFTQIKNYSKSVSEQMMFVPFVRLNQKLYIISFTNVLTRGDFGTILSLIGAVYQISRFVFHCRMLYLVSYLSNGFKQITELLYCCWKAVFVGLQKKPNKT